MSVESALLAAFAKRLGPVRAVGYHAVPWCSATFSGARHVFRIETQEGAEISIPRGFVADIAVILQANASEQQIDVEALTIDA